MTKFFLLLLLLPVLNIHHNENETKFLEFFLFSSCWKIINQLKERKKNGIFLLSLDFFLS